MEKQKYNLINRKFLNSLKHRGPTNQSIYQKINKKNNIFFAFSRLAIIDLDSRSNQPYIYKNLTLCFNGEIYNYKIIKNELLKKGITFETSSDTEVLIKFIYHEGIKKINKLEGMWAFVLYDSNKNKIIFCRDRFGEKPLYYTKIKKNIYFASEIFQLKNLLKKK